MALLSVGAGYWDCMLSDWSEGSMTGLNPPQRQRASCQQSTQQGVGAGILDGGSERRFFFFAQEIHLL